MTIAGVLGLLAWAGGPTVAAAQGAPVDVAWDAPAGLELPEVPEGFRREERGAVTWDYPAAAASAVERLQGAERTRWARVTHQLVGERPIDGRLLIRVGRTPEEMRALAPPRAPPPAYATGVAYPARGLILLTLSAPETWERPDMTAVLTHELSHIALHRAVAGQPVPRWFSEGVAIHQAGEASLARVQTLWGATVGGRLLPLRRLDRGFSARPHQVSLAYAQSADFVRWLLDRSDGEDQFRRLLHRIAGGRAFGSALEVTYSRPPDMLEDEWKQDLAQRYSAFPLLLGSGSVWVLLSLLLVVAYVRRRRKDRARLDAWEAEEEERASLEAAHAVLTSSRLPATETGPTPERRDGDDEPSSHPGRALPGTTIVLPPEAGEPGVPTVEHEGRSHTLH